MRTEKKWVLLEQDDAQVKALSDALGVSSVTARVLINRGYSDVEKAKAFIEKSESFLHNPFLLRDMDKAVSRILRAIENNEKITVYGDYDADGVTSTSLLLRYFRSKEANADFYIPSREEEGYGINREAINTIKESGTSLIVTVDTGITAAEEAAFARELGMDMVITDHHQCPQALPDAVAVVNPHRPDCEYPYKDLAGVGVAFKLVCALELAENDGGNYNIETIKDVCREYIALAAIGTIADIMPVTGENRIIIHIGLNMIRGTEDIGIKALFAASDIETDTNRNKRSVLKRISVSSVAFGVVPRINASGRMGDAGRAVQLFMTKSPELANAIAEELCAYNRERQALEYSIFSEAEKFLRDNPDCAEKNILVIAGEDWHNGVIGIVASKITEKYGKPSVLISLPKSGDEGRGSARSVAGFDIFSAFCDCSELLIKFGGHEGAAGLSILRENINSFREKINEYAGNIFSNGMPEPECKADCIISPDEINMIQANELYLLEPYGIGNPAPIFMLEDAVIDDIVMLKGDKHTKAMIDCDNTDVPALFFGRNLYDEGYEKGDEADILFNMDVNEFRGVCTVQLMGKEIRFGGETAEAYAEAEKDARRFVRGDGLCAPDDFPLRDDFADFYRYLRKNLHTGKCEINAKSVLRLFPEISYLKLLLMILVLEDCALIHTEMRSGLNYVFSVPSVTEKTDITKNRLLEKIKIG